MKQVSIDALNNHLFETIEMLKNNNDKNASDNEKIDVETAKAIADLGKIIVDGYKVKTQVLNMLCKTEEPTKMKQISIEAGILKTDKIKLNDGI